MILIHHLSFFSDHLQFVLNKNLYSLLHTHIHAPVLGNNSQGAACSFGIYTHAPRAPKMQIQELFWIHYYAQGQGYNCK